MANGIWVIPTYRRCSPHIIKRVRLAADKVSMRVRHRLFVHVSGDQVLIADGRVCYGYFHPNGPKIEIAGGMYGLLRSKGYSRKEAYADIMDTFLHEFVHYEQWRDGKPMTERGVAVRAASLARKLKLE